MEPYICHWESLEKVKDDEEINKEQKLNLIKEAVESRKEMEQELSTIQKDKQIEEEREAVRLQMRLDTKARERLEDLKKQEKEAAEKELYETFEKLKFNEKVEVNEKKIVENEKNFQHDEYYRKFDQIDSDYEGEESDEKKKENENDEIKDNRVEEIEETEEEEIQYIPPPRTIPNAESSTASIKINFTPRYFPTPLRESKASEEEDWIAKNKIHLSSKGSIKGNVQEEDPLWLKAKGDDFYRSNDCLSAINAYSAALMKNLEYLEALMNRSAAYMKVNRPKESIEDCLRGITLLEKKIMETSSQSSNLFYSNITFTFSSFSVNTSLTPQNFPPSLWGFVASSIKLLARKAMCTGSLGNYDESYEDFSLAHALFIKLNQLINDKNSQSKVKLPTKTIKNNEDIVHISQILPNITSSGLASDSNQIRLISKSVKLRKQADGLFAKNNLIEAKELYDSSLECVNGVHIASLVNRAALYMALVIQEKKDENEAKNYYELAIKDCTQALKLLEYNDKKTNEGSEKQLSISSSGTSSLNELNLLSSLIPLNNSNKFTNYLIVCLSRRSSCYFFLNKFEDALLDLKAVLELDPNNQQVNNDVQKIENKLKEIKN